MKILTRNLVIKTLQYKASNGTDFFYSNPCMLGQVPLLLLHQFTTSQTI